MTDAPAVLVARGLAVRAGGRRLLAPSDFELRAGERVLLVGPSGAGKSLLADLLLGFAGPETRGLGVEGELLLDGEDLLGVGVEARDARVGAVFQLQRSGLFDDLTIEQNLRFGSGDADERARIARALGLEPRDRPVTVCSGGERVRVALARTLLRGGDVLVLDEPTTGLDPTSARQVLEAIRASHRRLTLVITHDPAVFAAWADVVLFLDPADRRVRRLAPGPEGLAAMRASLERGGAPAAEPPSARRPLRARLARRWRDLALGTSDVLLDWAWLPLVPLAFARGGHPLDGPRLRASLRRDLAPGVALFVALSAVLVAVTGTYFLFERLPERVWTEPLLQEDLVAGLGLVATRVGVPLLVSVLLAAKLGASAAAHLGHMSLTRQTDALALLRVPGRRHLLLPTAASQLLAAVLFTGLGAVLAWAASMVVFLATHPGFSARYFHGAFVQEIAVGDAGWALAKVGASAVGVAAVAYRVGTAPKRAPEQVVRAIHATLLRGLLLVLAVHALFAFLEF